MENQKSKLCFSIVNLPDDENFRIIATEYRNNCSGSADVLEIECRGAKDLIDRELIPFKNRTTEFIEQQLCQRFETADAFVACCQKNGIDYSITKAVR